MLQSDPNNISLWQAYAHVETMRGNLSQANRVYAKSLALCSSLPKEVQEDMPLLVRPFAETEFDQIKSFNFEQKFGEVRFNTLSILLTLTEGKYQAPSKKSKTIDIAQDRIFAARNAFASGLEEKVPFIDSKPNIYVDYVVCYSLFVYLAFGILPALEIFTYGLEKLKQRNLMILKANQPASSKLKSTTFDAFGSSLDHYSEQLMTAKINLIYRHYNNFPFTPPSLLRNLIIDSLNLHPLSFSIILAFVESESRSKIAGRVRLYFDQNCKKLNATGFWLLAIQSDSSFHYEGSNRIKNLFERALRHDSPNRQSPTLWQSYIAYEVQRKRYDDAKNILYRAIKAVPWMKNLYLSSIKLLANHIEASEITELIHLLSEKELRLRVIPPF
jgi:tetratricopeptide (TPR) repeat protein